MNKQFESQVPTKRNKTYISTPIYRVYNGAEKICESVLNNKKQIQQYLERNYTIIFTGSYVVKSKFF